MLNVESLFNQRFPGFLGAKPRFGRRLLHFLRHLFHERELRQFSEQYPHLEGFDFAEQVLEHFDFSYTVRAAERSHIPRSGRVIIFANHPIGTLDGLALLTLVRELRSDVKVVGNDLLTAIKPLSPLLLAVDALGGKTARESLLAIEQHLVAEGAVIIFPAGEVSRLSARGIRDRHWQSGIVRFCEKTQSPLVPIHINARNSVFFYALSLVARPLSTLWLVREMFKQTHNCVDLRIGRTIASQDLLKLPLTKKEKAKLLRKHLYRIGKSGKGVLPEQSATAAPEERAILRRHVRAGEPLGTTSDGKQIFLFHGDEDPLILREIGRLREISFRAVGEGTGKRRDSDSFDRYYKQLLLWDDDDLEIAGAYRFAPCQWLDGEPLYTQTLFHFSDAMQPILAEGIELGRSFVQPRYWGRRSLDYLWYGIGAFLARHPEFRYLFGPVSLSNNYPAYAMALIVHYYRSHFPARCHYAQAHTPYHIEPQLLARCQQLLPGVDPQEEFIQLKEQLNQMQMAVPTLYKQYADLCEPGGVEFAQFNLDPQFGHCVDGLIIVDLSKLKAPKRARYLSASG